MPRIPADPWLTHAMRHGTLIETGETAILKAVRTAQSEFLADARSALIPGETTTAAGDPRRSGPFDPTRLLHSWPDTSRWRELLHTHVLPVIRRWWRRVFGHAAGSNMPAPDEETWQLVADEYTTVLDADTWSEHVYEQVHEEIADSAAYGDSIDLVRGRLARLLDIDAPVRRIRDVFTRRSRQESPKPYEPNLDASDYTWLNDARARARWFTVGAANRATIDAAQRDHAETGDGGYLSWMATPDEVTRPTHWVAHKQSVPLGTRFHVGRAELRYPGDPLGPAAETANCRCTVLHLDHDEHNDSNRERAMELPNRTDTSGNPLVADAGDDPTSRAEKIAMLAAGRLEPDPAVFANPKLSGPTKITVTDEGSVYGHVACWGTDHISFPGQGVKPPHSETDYALFHRHPVVCADGTRVRTGPLVMGTSHADLHMSLSAASNHYDHTGHVVADVVAGEDAYGIWVAGTLHPETTPLQVSILDRYSLSGDWRAGELVAALVVNTPGFPIPDALAASGEITPTAIPETRVSTDAQGHQYALVAAGMVSDSSPTDPATHELTQEVRSLRDELQAERLHRHHQELNERARTAWERVQQPRRDRVDAFAASASDGRPKQITSKETTSRALNGDKPNKAKTKGPDPKQIGDKHAETRQKAEQGLLDDDTATDPNAVDTATEDQGLLDDGYTGPAQEDWDVLAAIDDEDAALIEDMTGESLQNPGTGEETDDDSLMVDEEPEPETDSGEAGDGKLTPSSSADPDEDDDEEGKPPKKAVTAASSPNWVSQGGGLPPYIKRIAKHLKRKGMTESHAIATAVNVVKKMCTTGDTNWPGKQNVKSGSKAQACSAVAKWEAMKTKSKATSGGTNSGGKKKSAMKEATS